MTNYGFIRTAAATPIVKVADIQHNTSEICRLSEEAIKNQTSILVFPELSVTGSTCGDLFRHSTLLKASEKGVSEIARFSQDKDIVIVIGAPVSFKGKLYNCAVVISDGIIHGIVPKAYTAGSRQFTSGLDRAFSDYVEYAGQICPMSTELLFEIGEVTMGIEIGEDLWAPQSQSTNHALAGAHIIAHPAADEEILMRDTYRKTLIAGQSAKTITGYIHAAAGFGESTTDLVHAGASSIWEAGKCMAANERFSIESSIIYADIDIEKIENERIKSPLFISGTDEDYIEIPIEKTNSTDFSRQLFRHIEPRPFAKESELDYRCSEILELQVAGLVKRLSHINCKSAIIGISGGLDSTLALLVTTLAFDKLGWSRERIIGVTMPGYGTTSRTKNNATDLMDALGISSREVSIVKACDQHFQDIGHDPKNHNITYENSQARERTQILMDIANQAEGIVIGTGDLSELALGWATYNGDHMSMYGVNAGIPKTLVRGLVKWIAENRFETEGKERSAKSILLDIIDTPISPELLPANDKGEIQQVTEDLVGPYELHDFFIYNFIRNGYGAEKIYFLAQKAFVQTGAYEETTIKKWLKTFVRRFFNQQFKRSCLPDGPKVGSVGLSPRGDWQMPSDASSASFLDSIE